MMVLTLLLAAAAQAAAPAVTADTSLMLFFDSGESEIRREWEPVLDRAARAAADGARLRVTGHSDRPGSPAVNRRVGLERARAVAAALVARGVPAAAIATASAGEDAPLIPTEDGVREIQNRRVVISVER